MRADIHIGDARTVLETLPSESVHCCVTSPPYWGLRDYGVSGQLGLERTPEEYVERMVAVFREVRRVLREDGTLWLNIGDSYATGGGAVGRCPGGGEQGERFLRQGHINTQPNRMKLDGLKSKDLIGIPWRLAFALQADGWWIRSEIVWAKKAPMPESVTDRPTSSHEKIFLLSKAERYYYDAEAVREKSAGVGGGGFSRSYAEAQPSHGAMRLDRPTDSGSRNLRNVWHLGPEPFPEAHFATFPTEIPRRAILAGCPEGGVVLDPFNGAGTTGVVAGKLSRDYIGIELNPAYAEMSEARILREVGPLLVTTEIHGLAIEATP